MTAEPRETDLFALVLEVINPALVMGLVGSLAFFLLDVCYRGNFDDQLHWTLFFFVFAIVLVTRISFTMGSDKAAGYGMALGAVTFLATMRFVKGLGVVLNLLIILVISGSAYLLTKDTTWMGKPDRKPERGLADVVAEPWQLISQPRSKRRPHGLWVVWFTLAALPLFGIGQSLIPVEDAARRQLAFWRMTMYVACGLGLLLTTALVNLRQYLKARKLKLPAPLAARWLATGAIIVITAMVVAALLPRPQSETPLIAMTPWGSAERDANRIAPNSDSTGRGEGDPGGDGQDKEVSQTGSGKGQPDEKAKGKSKRGEKGSGGDKAAENGEGNGSQGNGGDGGGDKGDAEKSSPSSKPKALENVMLFVQSIVRWLVILAVIIIVVLVVLRFLANSQAWAAAWWQRVMSMFARKSATDDALAEGELPPPPPPRLFATYLNPFADGTAEQRDEAELIRYTFAALEAWSRENGRPRAEGDTPIELARQVGEVDHDLEEPAARLAASYSRLAYARRIKAGHEREIAKAVWDAMDVAFVTNRRGNSEA
jgi:Domain of unknown function (DUF4129)